MTGDVKKRKRSYYTGALAEPIKWVPTTLPPGMDERSLDRCPPEIAEKVRQDSLRNHYAQLNAFSCNFIALTNHFGIDRSRPGWGRDLALSLARRHEPGLFRGETVSYAVLFERHGIDPGQPDADFALAIELARRHVPGMKFKDPEPVESRLSTIEFVQFVIAVTEVARHLIQTVGKCSGRQVVAILLDPKRLRTILEPTAAEGVIGMIKSRGNTRRDGKGALSNKALRDYLRQMRTAWQDYRAGRARAIQQQYIEEVLPFIETAARPNNGQGGQIGSPYEPII